jgi:hypothetical protein
MKTQRFLIAALVAIVVLASTAPVWALYRQLQTNLTGPAIGNKTPSGDAKVDQSRLPAEPGRLEVRVKDVNLPDGTSLQINLGGHFAGDGTNLGSFTINGGQGQKTVTVPFGVGRTDPIGILQNGRVILAGGAPWKV